jgi:hypothetical protein
MAVYPNSHTAHRFDIGDIIIPYGNTVIPARFSWAPLWRVPFSGCRRRTLEAEAADY